jgi:uncharacterized protein (DUF697 family)
VADAAEQRDDGTEPPAIAASVAPPVVWLLGKVQSGKSSIVRALTGCADIDIGAGYQATTQQARVFDFPKVGPEVAPLIRFLDTRGLGEALYDPSEEIKTCEQQAHLLLVVMKALDHQQSAVFDVVTTVRRRRPDWPVLVVQTTLHEAYPPGGRHPHPYPFADLDPATWQTAGVPKDLVRSLMAQRARFSAAPGRDNIAFVPIDFTLPQDGYEPPEYGLQALIAALGVVAPAAVTASIRGALALANVERATSSYPLILKFATAAAAADLVPVAGAVAVPGLQAKLLHSLAAVYGVPWDRRTTAQFAGCLGTSTVVRMLSTFGMRELVKLVPVYGQTVGSAAAAATSFATTFAVGQAATYFLGQRRLGDANPHGVQNVYANALRQAFKMDRQEGQPWDQKP